MSRSLRVLVVDDSVLMRNLVAHMIEEMPGVELVGRAANGAVALRKLSLANPDLIILDLEMPEMDGLQFLDERRRRGIDIPVIILSSLATRGAKVTMQALQLGASDFVLKPTDSPDHGVRQVGEQLQTMIRVYGGRHRKSYPGTDSSPQPEAIQPPPTAPTSPARIRPAPRNPPASVEVVAIGVSTGGPNAMRELLSALAPDFPVPIIVVQHMPEAFTREFAASLDRVCALEVREATDEDLVKPGRVFIAPGNHHIRVADRHLARAISIGDDAPVSGHRPSADVLFASVAKVYGRHTLGVIMTGMGRDGAEGIGEVFKAGGVTLAQDEETSVVYGMPRVAVESGVINFVVPLPQLASRISQLVAVHARS